MEQAEIDKIVAEKEKILAEKNRIEQENKNYWRKPVISGLTFAFTIFGLLVFINETLYSQLREANALEIAKREYENLKTKDSIQVSKKELTVKVIELEALKIKLDSAEIENKLANEKIAITNRELIAREKAIRHAEMNAQHAQQAEMMSAESRSRAQEAHMETLKENHKLRDSIQQMHTLIETLRNN